MKRLLYEKLLEWKNSPFRKPLLLKGTRQVGKTFLLKEFGGNEFRHVHYLNFEKNSQWKLIFEKDLDAGRILREIELVLQTKIDLHQDLMIFDEIQECPNAISSLKYFNEDIKDLALACAGSHIGVSLSEKSFPIGQVDMLQLYPMNFEEFLLASRHDLWELFREIPKKKNVSDLVHHQLWEMLLTYYLTGGMPEVIKRSLEFAENNLERFTTVRNIQESILNGFRSDFSKHAGKENANHILQIFENIPLQLSRVMDASVTRFKFKGVIANKSKFGQLQGPIEWLQKTGLVIPVYIVETPQKPLISYIKPNIFKLYFFDVGLLGCMLNLSLEDILNQNYGRYKGFYAENFVAQEFLKNFGSNFFSWQGRQSEIEFLCIIGNEITPIEVKSGIRTNSKSLAVYRQKYSPPLAIKISANTLDLNNDNFHHYSLYLAGLIGDEQSTDRVKNG
jgi:predicted AAA+ superfamily ATPase